MIHLYKLTTGVGRQARVRFPSWHFLPSPDPATLQGSRTIQVFMRDPSGKLRTLNVSDEVPFVHVVAEYAAKTGVAVERLYFRYAGRILVQNDWERKSLRDYNIPHESTIHVGVRLLGD